LWSRFEGTEEIGIFRKSSLPEEKVVPIQSPTINLSELDVHKINISPVAPKPSDDMLIEEYNQIITHRRESNDYWKEYIPVFIEKISEVLPKRYAKPYAEWLCSNLTFLKRDNMFISQLRLAGELNITQTTISKHIRLLINAGILEVKGEYVKSKIPRKYGLGSVMKSAVQKENQFDVLTEEYASGTTNEQMLSDIRSLVHCGVEPEEVVEFIELKMTAKPRGRQRTSREIIHAVDSWIAKTNRKIPSSPIIDIEKYKKEVFGYANQRRAARSH
jgi:DNA-binding Lrp family transcriptional regulator